MAKQARIQRKTKSKHRAVKRRSIRPLDIAKKDNHTTRHRVKKDHEEALFLNNATVDELS